MKYPRRPPTIIHNMAIYGPMSIMLYIALTALTAAKIQKKIDIHVVKSKKRCYFCSGPPLALRALDPGLGRFQWKSSYCILNTSLIIVECRGAACALWGREKAVRDELLASNTLTIRVYPYVAFRQPCIKDIQRCKIKSPILKRYISCQYSFLLFRLAQIYKV